jgi:hypothetical protein
MTGTISAPPASERSVDRPMVNGSRKRAQESPSGGISKIGVFNDGFRAGSMPIAFQRHLDGNRIAPASRKRLPGTAGLLGAGPPGAQFF